MATRLQTVASRLTVPVDAASAVAFRVAFGALMLVAVARFFAHDWIASYYLEPERFFSYRGFSWVKPWPGVGMYVHFAAMGGCALLVMLGRAYRPAIIGFGLLFTYAHLIDKTNYLNHYYLVSLLAFVMALLPLGRGQSTVPAYVVWALRAQLAVVYVFGGVAKLQADWLVHAEPLGTWLATAGDVPLVGPLLVQPWMAHAMSWAGAGFDLTIVAWLLWPRSRPWAYAAVVAFHVLTARLFHLGMFPYVMIALTPIFFAPDWPRRFGWRRRRTPPGAPLLERAALAPRGTGGRVLAAVLIVHFSLQVLLPLRGLVYAGDPRWTEEGFRWAWQVMVMEKSGVAEFVVRDPDTGRTWRVAATDYWTRYQAAMMATQPDMILQAAHVVAADFRARGVRAPEVRADVFVSLNGRPRARLVDPEVDLAATPDTLGSYPWILPAPEVAPP